MSNAKKTAKRKRLPPDVRKNQILDHAASLIRQFGVSAVNMDRLARDAGVSKPLVYNYFPNRTELLKSLLRREVESNRERNRVLAEDTSSMEELVRATSRSMLQYVRERGIIIQQLMHEPDIADVLKELNTQSHRSYVRYLAKRLQAEYTISEDLSEIVIDIGLGLSSAAGAHLERTKADIDLIEDVLVAMIMGSLNAASEAYEEGTLGRKKPKRRKSAKQIVHADL